MVIIGWFDGLVPSRFQAIELVIHNHQQGLQDLNLCIYTYVHDLIYECSFESNVFEIEAVSQATVS